MSVQGWDTCLIYGKNNQVKNINNLFIKTIISIPTKKQTQIATHRKNAM